MATIRRRVTKAGQTRYQAIIRLEDGSASKAFSNKTSARKWALRVENEIRQGVHSTQKESSKHSVAELITRYEADHSFQQKKDKRNQSRHLDFWRERLGDKKLIDVSRALIIEVRDEIASVETSRGGPRAAATVNRFIAVIRQIFSRAVEWQWVESNPAKGIRSMTEPPGVVRYLSDQERTVLLEATKELDPILNCIVVVALSTGARRGELMGLEWSDIHWKENFAVLRDTKNSENRALPLVGLAMKLLNEHRDANRQLADKLVFPDPRNRTRPWNFEGTWRKAKKQAEIENFRFHDLRHSAASYLAMGGASLAEIAEILGHKTLAMVKRYSHLSNAHVSSVVSKMNEQIFGG